VAHRRVRSRGPWSRRRVVPVHPGARISKVFCTALWVALVKDPVSSTNLPFEAGSADPPICGFGLGHKSKDLAKKVTRVRFLLFRSGPEGGWICLFVSSGSYFCLSACGLRRFFFFPLCLSEYSFALLCCLGCSFHSFEEEILLVTGSGYMSDPP